MILYTHKKWHLTMNILYNIYRSVHYVFSIHGLWGVCHTLLSCWLIQSHTFRPCNVNQVENWVHNWDHNPIQSSGFVPNHKSPCLIVVTRNYINEAVSIETSHSLGMGICKHATLLKMGCYITPLGHYTILVIKKLQRKLSITGMA